MTKPRKNICVLILNNNESEVEGICSALANADIELTIEVAAKRAEFVKKTYQTGT